MARARSVVGLGWLAIDDRPDGSAPSGLAAEAALAATRDGHDARVVGRVGQDRTGDELVTMLGEAGIDTAVLQRDPDLPTPERLIRTDGAPSPRVDELPAAPDHLQWDFDLEDTARWADVVVFGLESWRSGQARAEELRFLDEAASAVRVADLTRRAPSGRVDASTPRSWIESALERAQVARLDLGAIVAAGARRPEDADATIAAASAIARRHELVALVAVPASDDAAAREVVVDGRDGRVVVANGHERDAIATELVRAGVAALLDPSAEGIGAALARPTAR